MKEKNKGKLEELADFLGGEIDKLNEITFDGGEMEITVEPTEDQMKELEYLENKKAYDESFMDEMHYNMQPKVRREVLNELWAADKVNHQGHWYVKLNDVVKIIGDYNELYENESKS
tara:strand:+ start:183 stop:533 length:351 start_codon:yes stop_codon:yes gene_type:complete